MEQHKPDAAVVGNFEITVNLTDKRQLRMTGYVYSDDDPQQINGRLDSFMDVADRQVVRADIVTKEAELVVAERSVEALVAHNEELMKLKDDRKLTSQQKQQLAQFESSVRFHTKQKESLHAAIAAARKKLLNGAAA